MNDKEYESSVAKYLVKKNPEFLVRYNQKREGILSKRNRQIDTLLINEKKEIVIECKFYNKKIDLKIIESFIGFLEDVNIREGILITNIGVTKSVPNRLANSDIKFHILSENELSNFRLAGLFPIEGNLGAILMEPNGWIYSGNVEKFRSPCVFIPIGSAIENILKEGNFLYLNLIENNIDIDEMIKNEKNIINTNYQGKSNHKISKDEKYLIRKSFIKSRNRFDIGIFRLCSNGAISVHGILKPCDVNWTITSLKKTLDNSTLFPCKLQ